MPSFQLMGQIIARPQAILAISGHWYVHGTFVTGDEYPRTIHDFQGFPDELFQIQYPAPGDPKLARKVCSILGEEKASVRLSWGIDHGAWSVLRWMYPEADIPVVQLSIDAGMKPDQHYELARPLLQLRDEGVLILGTGNVTHNLADAFRRMSSGSTHVPEWSIEFDSAVKQALLDHDTSRLLRLWPETPYGAHSHPTPDHWLPLIYAYAATEADEIVEFPIEGFDMGLSMRSVLFGRQ